MDRLTHERKSGIKTGYWSPAKKEELVQHLAAYERTGLTPDQIREMDQLYLDKCREVTELKKRPEWIPVTEIEDIKNNIIDHDLKILPEYFNDVWSGRKKFELRKNDRNYRPGDVFVLREWNGRYTGRFYIGLIGYVLEDCAEHGLMPGYCIFCW